MDISRRDFMKAVALGAVLPAVGASSPASAWTVNRRNMWPHDLTSAETLRRCDKILAIDSDNLLARVHRGSVPVIYTDKARAWDDLSRAVFLENTNPAVYYMRGVCFDNAQDLQIAISLISKHDDIGGRAICSYPDHYIWQGTESGELVYMSLRDLGYAEEENGRFCEAIAAFEKAGHFEVISAENLETWAESSFAVGTYTRALVEFDRLIAIQPRAEFIRRREECWAAINE